MVDYIHLINQIKILCAFFLMFLLLSSVVFADTAIKSFRVDTPYVCSGEDVTISWEITSSSDKSAIIRCEFDFEGDGRIDRIMKNCPLVGNLSYSPAVTGAIKPRMKIKINGVTITTSRTSGLIQSQLKGSYTRGAEIMRFGNYGPDDFYATDVAVDHLGKVYVTNWLTRRVSRYSVDGTKELDYPQLTGQPRRLTVDINGRVYVSEVPINLLHIYDKFGVEVETWDMVARYGSKIGTGGIEFVAPDKIIIAAANDTVMVLSLTGDLLFQFGSRGTEPGQFVGIFDVDVAPDGSYFVVDRSHRLHKFDSGGNFLWTVGSYGVGPGQFDTPVAVATDLSGNVFVSDRKNYRIQKFDSNGNFLLEWGSKGTEDGQFMWHYGMDIDRSTGHIWIAGYHGHDVQKFTGKGQLLSRWIGHITGPDEFAYAAGIAVSDNKIFVVDQVNQQVKVFDKLTTSPLYQFGERGDGLGVVFNFPRAISLAPNGDLYISEDRHIRRFSQDGVFIRLLRTLTKNISATMGLYVTDKILYQADTNNNTLNARNPISGKAVWIAGSSSGSIDPGQFSKIWGVTLGDGGTILATDSGNRVQLFTPNGQFIRQWTTMQPGTTDTAVSRAIAYDSSRGIVYVGGGKYINAYDMCGTALFSWTPDAPPSPLPPLFDHLTVDAQGSVFATDHFGTVYGIVPQ